MIEREALWPGAEDYRSRRAGHHSDGPGHNCKECESSVFPLLGALWIRAWQLTKDLELVRSERPHCGSRASPLDCSWPLNGCPLIWAYSYSILTKCWLCFVAVAKTSILIQQLYAVIQRYTSYLTAHGGPNTWNDVWHWLRPPQPWGYALLSPKWGFVDLTTTLSTLDWRVTIKS